MAADDETRVFTANPTDAPEALVGTVLAGRYRIQELLGVGAMGAVYLGQHLKIGRKDAIKVLHSALARDPDAIARFDRGARNVGAIRHPNVCTIYDFSDTEGGLQYLAMEFVPGETLKDLLDREGVLTVERSVRIAEQAAAALQAAHNAGIVHRDLKPANIMIATGADGEDMVKVVDFDISKGSQEATDPEVTRLGFVVGTPEYMSPEQLWGGALDGRSDIYSLALVLYRMLTGKLPFRGDNLQDIMSARLTDVPMLRLEELAPGKSFNGDLQEVLNRALHRKATERTSSAADFAAQLRATHAEPPTRVTGGAVPQTRVTPAAEVPATGNKKTLRMALIAGGIAVASVAAVGVMLNQGEDPGAAGTESVADSTPTSPLSSPDPSLGNAAATNSSGTQQRALPNAGTGETSRQPAGRTGTDNTGAANAPAPVPVNPPTRSGPQLTPERASAILGAQREQLMAPPADPATLRAMRDTASALYDLPGVTDPQRGLAAFIAANLSSLLGDSPACVTWAGKAAERVPASTNYAAMRNRC